MGIEKVRTHLFTFYIFNEILELKHNSLVSYFKERDILHINCCEFFQRREPLVRNIKIQDELMLQAIADGF